MHKAKVHKKPSSRFAFFHIYLPFRLKKISSWNIVFLGEGNSCFIHQNCCYVIPARELLFFMRTNQLTDQKAFPQKM